MDIVEFNQVIREIERQEDSAIARFQAYKHDGDIQDLVQAEFSLGKMAGKIELLEELTSKVVRNKYDRSLIVLRQEIENCLENGKASLKIEQAKTAKDAWAFVVMLIESGTPLDGVKTIAESTIKGLNAEILTRKSLKDAGAKEE